MKRISRGLGRAGFSCAMAVVFALAMLSAPYLHAQPRPPVYPNHMDAKAQIHEGLLTAAMQHRRVLLNFGSNSCGKCQLLNTYLKETSIFNLVKRNYVVVYINVGPNFDQHKDVAKVYGVTLSQGVPVLLVLDKPGHAVSPPAEFPHLRKQGSGPVRAFLEKWKPAPASAP